MGWAQLGLAYLYGTALDVATKHFLALQIIVGCAKQLRVDGNKSGKAGKLEGILKSMEGAGASRGFVMSKRLFCSSAGHAGWSDVW